MKLRYKNLSKSLMGLLFDHILIIGREILVKGLRMIKTEKTRYLMKIKFLKR